MQAGKLPFRHQGDRIAKYGKGFSNLLTVAGNPDETLSNAVLKTATKNHRDQFLSHTNSIRGEDDLLRHSLNNSISAEYAGPMATRGIHTDARTPKVDPHNFRHTYLSPKETQ